MLKTFGGFLFLTVTGTVVALAAIAFGQPWRGGQVPVAKVPHDSGAIPAKPGVLAGSSSCRGCHEEFYRKWATSHHGLAMQPFTAELAAGLSDWGRPIKIGSATYRAELSAAGVVVVERGDGGEERQYRLVHAMGGKNVYNFLTPLDHGRLQVLPLAYDVRQKQWADMPASGVRHYDDRADAPLDWRHGAFTFNTSCYGCHVSQLARNYNPATKTYDTRWAEPGINCETCHGPAAEHVRAMSAVGGGPAPRDLKILSMRTLSVEQINDACASCHAKMAPITSAFKPGERYFDHFDLITADNPDFYPDGRDLGENFTFTSWRASPCVQPGKMRCLHCHTSSGRYRHRDRPDESCMPCHADKVAAPAVHSHHKDGGAGSRCIACHMPMTTFAAMRRTDHSMRSPTPGTTLAHKSPNACNLCHKDKDAAWADALVRKWYKRDYQAPVVRLAALVAAARKGDWVRLPDMLAEVAGKDRREVTAASLARLLRNCGDPRIVPAMVQALKDASPLVRAAAVESLGTRGSPEALAALESACSDPYRLVRVRAAAFLAIQPAARLPAIGPVGRAAMGEYLASLHTRLDLWSSQYGLGNYHLAAGDLAAAARALETAVEIEPGALLAHVNLGVVYGRLRRPDEAEKSLRRALALDSGNAAANLNLGMLLAERKCFGDAESAFRAALRRDPDLAAAAYNLSLLLARDRLGEAVQWARAAYRASPVAKYGYSLAYLLRRDGKASEAVATLRELIDREPAFSPACFLMADLLEQGHGLAQDVRALREALSKDRLPATARRELQQRLDRLPGR